ncbi:MAG: hypothetical protein Q9163_001604 [Psora crenata]
MAEGNIWGDPEKTPRPAKKRNIGMIQGEFVASPIASPEYFYTQSQSSGANSGLESHNSGRISPSKQMALLEDLEHPVMVLDFGSPEASIPEDVEKMRAEVQLLADDPPTLAEMSLPKRVVDYGIVLVPDDRIKKAYQQLQPLAPAIVKSWNHTTADDVRQTPIAVNIETKSPNKSWTDGKSQLAIWTHAFFKRLQKLVRNEAAATLPIPAMPLVIAQGHDWHLLIVSFQPSAEQRKSKTVIWQKIDIGNTRNCFDIHKVIAVLQLLMQWAETTWRPWFHSLLDLAKM